MIAKPHTFQIFWLRSWRTLKGTHQRYKGVKWNHRHPSWVAHPTLPRFCMTQTMIHQQAEWDVALPALRSTSIHSQGNWREKGVRSWCPESLWPTSEPAEERMGFWQVLPTGNGIPCRFWDFTDKQEPHLADQRACNLGKIRIKFNIGKCPHRSLRGGVWSFIQIHTNWRQRATRFCP